MEIADDDSQQEISTMTILIAFFMMAFLAAIIFTVVGYTKHQPILALFGAAFFLLVGGIATVATHSPVPVFVGVGVTMLLATTLQFRKESRDRDAAKRHEEWLAVEKTRRN